jgi:hypothetical protein
MSDFGGELLKRLAEKEADARAALQRQEGQVQRCLQENATTIS